ncbi:MAG: CHASE2 domain-containing protein [Bdellovibrionota bacterium]
MVWLKRALKSAQFKMLMLALSAGTLLTLALQTFELNLLEAYLYDFRMRNKGARNHAEHLVLISIDDKTVEKLNEFSPLSLKQHVTLLNQIGKAKPKAVAYFVDFNDSVLADVGSDDRVSKKNAEEFVKVADALHASDIPVILGTEIDMTGEIVPPFPLSKLPHRVAILHVDGTTFSEDEVTRRALFSIYDETVLHVRLAALVNGKTAAKEYRGVYQMPDIDANYFLINYAGPTQHTKRNFSEVSALDVIEGKISTDFFRNKIVLIGSKTKDRSNDYVYTPFSRTTFTNPKLTIHANIIETLIDDAAILQTSKAFDTLLSILLTTLVIVMLFRTTPIRGVVFTVACALIVLLLALAAFRYYGVWIRLSHPLMGIFFSYYVFVPYRLITEYKKRWEFQKKNEVLMQVEELKSNFMSLITHDLKTPVARIQGMAEMLARSGVEPKLVTGILSSTDELNNFITSILELAKIESNRINLDKRSKDINKIIEDCVRKFEFQAQSKKIAIRSELDPLFPIKIDVPLITKVISNLIDNAIKYSPEGAQIMIESGESLENPGYVEITITDTGHGIAPKDLENLFSKFYRPKNDVTLQTKGTGLGLYLSRYFVELHNGSLSAESVEGRGSMFTILLPTEDSSEKLAPPSSLEGEKAYV